MQRLDCVGMDEHLRAVSRVYGPETWEVYELLDRSLDPRGPDALLTLAGEHLTADVVGTEWREHLEERTQPVSRDLLRLARLRRDRQRIVEAAGEEIYRHIESNLHWGVFQFLGTLLPTVYVLRKPG